MQGYVPPLLSTSHADDIGYDIGLELYLKPFSSPLRTQYRTNELKEMHSLLLEKGLRVRVELDDFLAGWQDPSERRELDDGEDEGVDIAGVEAIFEERKRLMPY